MSLKQNREQEAEFRAENPLHPVTAFCAKERQRRYDHALKTDPKGVARFEAKAAAERARH